MRTILISGASSGIGLNIAYKELKNGNRISIGIRDLDSIKGSIIDPNIWPVSYTHLTLPTTRYV